MKKNTIILLCGAAGSGKDTSCEILKYLFATVLDNAPPLVKSFAFAAPLKHITSDLCRLFWNEPLDVDRMSELMYKEQEHPEHTIFCEGTPQRMTIRKLLQYIGTDVMRKHLSDDIFAQTTIQDVDTFFRDTSDTSESQKIAIITDLRFPNELECVRQYVQMGEQINMITVRIRRSSDAPNNVSHESESYFDRIQSQADVLIENKGTLLDLQESLRDLVLTFAN